MCLKSLHIVAPLNHTTLTEHVIMDYSACTYVHRVCVSLEPTVSCIVLQYTLFTVYSSTFLDTLTRIQHVFGVQKCVDDSF